MTLTNEPDIIHVRLRRFRFTVDQYHEMLARGIIEDGEPYELLNGEIVRKDRSASGDDPMTIGHDHGYGIDALNELNLALRDRGCYMRIQLPVTIPTFDEPEPDGAIVRGTREQYAGRHPTPADVLCVIEVADSSVHRDRNVKMPAYADAGIPVYVIVNLVARVVEVYSSPISGSGSYARADTLVDGKSVSFPTAKKPLTVPVRQLLPPVKSNGKHRNGRRR